MKYLLHLAYKGTNYQGWQRQKNGLGVQEVLENTLEKMIGSSINCVGCGRTDAGVHASQYFCHIVVGDPFDYDPVFRLNKMLPPDISIFECFEVPATFHAQKDATQRTYTYKIHTQKHALKSNLSAYYTATGLSIDRMQEAIALITPYQDFRSMCKQPDLYKHTICAVSKASLVQNVADLSIEITADRFLKGMVRILIGNILEIGYGRLDVQVFENCLQSGQPAPYFNIAYPQGLYLSKVKYNNSVVWRRH